MELSILSYFAKHFAKMEENHGTDQSKQETTKDDKRGSNGRRSNNDRMCQIYICENKSISGRELDTGAGFDAEKTHSFGNLQCAV